MVKNVGWLEPSYPGTEWPYVYEDIDRSPTGIAGQNKATPAEKVFAWHVITE